MSLPAGNVLAGVRAACGAVQFAAPAYSAEQVLGGPLDATAQRVVRVLGARQLAQAGLAVSFPAGPLPGLGVGVDAVHALSMVALAASRPRWRRPALISAATAAAFAAAGVLAARSVTGNRTFD
jgi:hypothetical protein